MKKILKLLDMRLSIVSAGLALTSLASLFFSPVIAANVLFQDDATRAIGQQHNFMIHGRFLNEAFSRIFSGMSDFPVDYGSLGQVLGVIVLVVAIIFLLHKKLNFRISSMLIVSPLIVNPFLLQNISYRYDSFGMLLGYALAIGAFAVFERSRKGIILPTVLLFFSFGLYQSMPNIFLMLIVLEFIYRVCKSREPVSKSVHTLFIQGLIYFLATLLYMITTRYIFIQASSRSTFDLTVRGIPHNIENLFTLLQSYFQGPLLAVASISLLAALTVFIIHIFLAGDKSRFIRLGVCVAGLMLLTTTLLGPLLVTRDALVFPRTVPAFALFGLLPGVALLLINKKFGYLQIAISGLIMLFIFQGILFAHTYGAFLRSQSDYRDLLISSVYHSVQENGLQGSFYIIGGSDSPISARKAIASYPVLRDYWGVSALNSPSWAKRLLRNYNVDVKVDWAQQYPRQTEAICSHPDIEPVVEGRNYKIYTVPINSSEDVSQEHVIFFRPTMTQSLCGTIR